MTSVNNGAIIGVDYAKRWWLLFIMKNLYLIRHGRQNSTLCNVDVELDAAGRRQAHLLGRRLQSYSICRIITSDLLRAKETGDIVNSYLHLPVIREEGLREINFGALTGHTNAYIKEHFGDFLYEQQRRKTDISYPEGECGADVVKRAYPVLCQLAEGIDENIAIVSHGGVIRSIVSHIVNAGPENKLLFGLDLENTSITHLKYDSQMKRFYLERFNDYGHLEQEPELLRRNWKQSLNEN